MSNSESRNREPTPPSEDTLHTHAVLLAGKALLSKKEIEWRASVLAKAWLAQSERARVQVPDFEGMIDNAAGASQSHELLKDKITREAVKANVYDPLVRLIDRPKRNES